MMQEARAVSKYDSFSKEPYIYALISIILMPEEEVLLLLYLISKFLYYI